MVNDPIKVVIAPWGNPFGWNKAKYSYEGQITEANTTLDVWLKYLKPHKVCLIVPDTVIDRKYVKRDYFQRFAKEGYCFYKALVEISIYSFLTDKRKVRNYSPEIVKFYVNYNTGTYENLKFERNASDYYLNLYWIFYKFFIKDLKILDLVKNKKPITLEVYLDTTHGVNFMPALTLEALQKFLKALSAAPIKIHLKVYNAEPVSPFNSNEVSELLLIYEETFEKLFTEITFTSEQKRKWVAENYDKYKEVLLFLTGVIKGYPLLVYNHFDLSINGSEQLNEDYIQNIINSYEISQKFELNECNIYKYPENLPEFFKECIGKLKDLENRGLVKVGPFEWRKLFLQLKNKENTLPSELDLLIVTLLLKLILQNIYKVKKYNEVSLTEIKKIIEEVYKNSPIESYVTQNLESTYGDICKGIPKNRVLLEKESLFNRTNLEDALKVKMKKLLRHFQSHLGLKFELVGLKTSEQIQTDKDKCSEDVPNNKDKIFLFYKKPQNEQEKEFLKNLWVSLIKNDLFGLPIP